MSKTTSNRILPTSSSNARANLLYVQEIGTLTSHSPHISTRNNIFSFLFFVVVQGNGTFTYHQEMKTLYPGDCIFINCEETYSHESSEDDPWTLTWVHFYGHNMKQLYEYYCSLTCPFYFHAGNLPEILATLSALYETMEHKDPMTEIHANKYLTDLITLIFHENQKKTDSLSMQNKLEQIRTYMSAHCSEKLTLDSLSSLFFISKFHLSREYKHFYGITLMNDLTLMRLSKAKSLLRFTEQTIDEIAIACGFTDASYFIRVFKNAENMTPFHYRAKW